MSKESYLQKVVLMESVETDSGDIRKSGNNGREYCQKSTANILENWIISREYCQKGTANQKLG